MALFSKRIALKKLFISDAEDPAFCYTWSDGGGRKGSVVCTGCRRLKDSKKVGNEAKLPRRKVEDGKFVDDGSSIYPHFCHPVERSKIIGVQERRNVQAELAQGSRENVASAQVRIDAAVVRHHHNKPAEVLADIRNNACGNKKATKQALYRAQTKRFLNVKTLAALHDGKCQPLWLTYRGRTAGPETEFYQELFLRHLDDEMAIFASPRQLELLKKSPTFISDGTFKSAPKNIYQVYRVFGFVKTQCFPMVIGLLRGKTGQIYNRFWSQVRIELDESDGEFKVRQANFDYEPASIQAFMNNFGDLQPSIKTKMCLFHVRQALHRRIQKEGFAELYSSPQPDGVAFQRIVRKIGALQFAPPNYMQRSTELIRHLVNNSELEVDVQQGLLRILDYYITTWVNNIFGATFFSLFDISKNRTTNHAESYHGRQRWFIQPNSNLGRWIANLQEVTNSEEETAVAIAEGRQQPNLPIAITAEIDASIAMEKTNIIEFLNTDYGEVEFMEMMSRYFGRIGHLVGLNAPRRNEIEDLVEEEAAMEQANASLDGSGLTIQIEDGENGEEEQSDLVVD